MRLAPIRSSESVELDTAIVKNGDRLPPFVRWDRFLEQWEWVAGEHITTIGPTGSGKTVLNRMLLRQAPIPWAVVMGIKRRDPELYGAFEKDGYELVRRFNAEHSEQAKAKVLLVPRTDKQGAEGRAVRARVFRLALNDVQSEGEWIVYADDIIVMAKQMNLAVDFEELWIAGRSEDVSVVASAQEPVNIPPMAYGAASHLFIFKNPDMYRVRRLGELTGFNRDVAFETIQRLPKHEFLYIHKDSGTMLRSRVLR